MKIEKNGLCGKAEARLYDQSGLLRIFRITKNITVTVGFEAVCDMMGKTGAQPEAFYWCGIGQGTTSPVPSNTILQSQLYRLDGGYERTASTVWVNNATFGAGVGTGTITESGLFNATIQPAVMLCRQTFGAITKGASDTLVVTWSYSLS